MPTLSPASLALVAMAEMPVFIMQVVLLFQFAIGMDPLLWTRCEKDSLPLFLESLFVAVGMGSRRRYLLRKIWYTISRVRVRLPVYQVLPFCPTDISCESRIAKFGPPTVKTLLEDAMNAKDVETPRVTSVK